MQVLHANEIRPGEVKKEEESLSVL